MFEPVKGHLSIMMVETKAKRPSFWPLISVLQKGGFFPFKKVKDSETGKSSMQPLNGFVHLVIYIICTTSVIGFYAYSLSLLYSEKFQNALDFFFKFIEIGAGMQHSAFDLKVMMSLYGFLICTHCIILSRLVASKQKFCNVYNYFRGSSSIDYQITMDLKKPFYFHLLKIGIIVSGCSIWIVGYSMNIIDALDVKGIYMLSYGVSWILQISWMFGPLMAFHLYFLEIALILNSWILTFKAKLQLEPQVPFKIFQECKQLHNGLQMFTETISPSIFWLFVMNLIMAVVEVYLLVAFFISQDEFGLSIILLMIGYGSFGGLFIFLAERYCNFSQIIKDSIDGIKNDILDLDINEDQVCIIDGNVRKLKHVKKRIVSGLDGFQGFHGNGYFTLGKELLTSIVANFVTYLIILVQFKVSEMSTQ